MGHDSQREKFGLWRAIANTLGVGAGPMGNQRANPSKLLELDAKTIWATSQRQRARGRTGERLRLQQLDPHHRRLRFNQINQVNQQVPLLCHCTCTLESWTSAAAPATDSQRIPSAIHAPFLKSVPKVLHLFARSSPSPSSSSPAHSLLLLLLLEWEVAHFPIIVSPSLNEG